MNAQIHYHIQPLSPEAHLFEVKVTIKQPAKSGQVVRLPAWIPGSYMIRDFARHIVSFTAMAGERQVAVYKIDKHTWQIEPVRQTLTLCYQIYAYDLSVRGAYLDIYRGFFNGANVFLMVDGYEDSVCDIEIAPPLGKAYHGWRVCTPLTPKAIKKASGYGLYRAINYEELIDKPVEMGLFEEITFKAASVPHQIIISGQFRADLVRLKRDIKKICESQVQLFGKPAPFEHYTFMLFVGDNGLYGGLEHTNSAALLASRDDLPAVGEQGVREGYVRLLGLISHEYFHSWNVKRIKPKAFSPCDLNTENYTRLLWAFEGITSYYDDLILVRAGIIDRKQYLGLLAKTITAVLRYPGRTKQTLEEASFDAWIKFYRPDENSPNASVSYYAKGCLVALALDLFIRRASNNKKSLDDVMRALWQKWLLDGQGIAEDEWERIATSVTGVPLNEFFTLALRSTKELPLAELLATQGVEMVMDVAASADDMGSFIEEAQLTLSNKPSLGVKVNVESAGIRLLNVLDNGAAQSAGLSGKDVIVAIDGLKAVDLNTQLSRFSVGDTVRIHAFRRDQLITRDIILKAEEPNTCRLRLLREDGAGWLSS